MNKFLLALFGFLSLVFTLAGFAADSSDDSLDEKKIAALKQRAFDGEAKAQYEYARYLAWLGKDTKETIEWDRKSAEQGYEPAQMHMASRCALGEGIEKSPEKMLEWRRKAAAGGSARAEYEIGYTYMAGKHDVKKDVAEGLKWYRLAAEHGFAPAMYRLAQCHGKGIGVAKDESLAFSWYKKAADTMKDHSLYNGIVASCYRDGKGVDKDIVKAFEYWKRSAASLQEGPSCEMLGKEYYAKGVVVEKDYKTAYYLCFIGKCLTAEQVDPEIANKLTKEEKAEIEIRASKDYAAQKKKNDEAFLGIGMEWFEALRKSPEEEKKTRSEASGN